MYDLRLIPNACCRSCAGVYLALFWFATLVGAEGTPADLRVDQLFSKWDRRDVPGCSVGIVRDGEAIYLKGFGSAQLDYEAPNTPQTIFEVGSAAKSFTSACIALLLDRGKISLDDEVRTYVPELQAHKTPIRIRDLIGCRSGSWDHWHLVQLAGWSSEPIQAPFTDEDLLTLLAGQKTLPFEPGTQFHYSSSDFFLLGIIIQRVTGKSLAEFARENLFQPLGMTQTYYEEDPTRIVKNRAVGYYRDDRGGEAIWRSWTSNAGGSGGCNLKTCVADLVRWEENFLSNRLGGGQYFNEFLSEGTLLGNRNVLDAMPTGRYRGLKRIQFTGGMPGYLAAMTRFPEQKFTVICLSNNSSEIEPWEMSQKIADIYLADKLEHEPKPAQAGNRQDAHTEPSVDELRDKVGAYRSDDGRIWRLSLKDGKLWITDHLSETCALHPLSATRFRADPHPEVTFVFNRPATEIPLTLTLEYEGGAAKFSRVELVEPSSLKLDEYVGDYHSGELAITYGFAIKPDALWVRVGSRGWERLDPTVQNEFVPHVRRGFDNRIFTFRRDDTNKVVAVSVTLWRVKDVRFEKQ